VRLIFDPENGCDKFLRNVGSHTDYMVLCLRTWQQSLAKESCIMTINCKVCWADQTAYMVQSKWLTHWRAMALEYNKIFYSDGIWTLNLWVRCIRKQGDKWNINICLSALGYCVETHKELLLVFTYICFVVPGSRCTIIRLIPIPFQIERNISQVCGDNKGRN
jgi:hypothetical protein